MSAVEIYTFTVIWVVIAVAIVLAAAVLLITIIVLAHKIATLAGAALEVVTDIEENTQCIWELDTTNEVAGNLLVGAKAILSNAGAIAGALTATEKKQNVA